MKKRVFIFNDGELKRKDNTVYFETEESKKYLPIEDIKEIIFPHPTVSEIIHEMLYL